MTTATAKKERLIKQRQVLWIKTAVELRDSGLLPLELPDYKRILFDRTQKYFNNIQDPGHRAREYQKCKEDVIYWLTYYGWLYNPFLPSPQDKIPYIPMAYQEEYITYVRKAIDKCNQPFSFYREQIVVPKTRETAGSWSTLAAQLHDWQFYQGSHLILSRNEDEVDEGGNMDTPFEKLRFLLRHQPEFLLPTGFDWNKHSHVMRLINPNGGHIGGDAMSDSAGAGGRVRSILYDEYGKAKKGMDRKVKTSCFGTSNLHIFVSTLEGSRNMMSRLVKNEDNEDATVIQLDWWKDPRKTTDLEFNGDDPTSSWQREAKKTDPATYASQVECRMDGSAVGGVYSGHFNETMLRTTLSPDYDEEIIVSLDPGPHFAAQWCQFLACGCYWIFQRRYWGPAKKNSVADIETIGEELVRVSNQNYPGFKHIYIGDPAGSHRKTSVARGKSEYMWLRESQGIDVMYSFMYKIPREEWITRGHQACISRMTQLCPKHKTPKLLVLYDPKTDRGQDAAYLVEALQGEYKFKLDPYGIPTGVVDEYHPIEDVADAFKYAPLFKGVYLPNTRNSSGRRKTVRGSDGLPRQSIEWLPPSQM